MSGDFELRSGAAASEVIVVGGGLAGLAAATYLARAGRRVCLLEKAGDVGGRAQTQSRDGFSMNLGPHALYRSGPAERVLVELGVAARGGAPSASGALGFDGAACFTLPTGPLSLLSTGYLRLAGKIEFARLLAGIHRLDPSDYFELPLSSWLASSLSSDRARAVVEALARVATYVNAPEQLSAGVAIAQLQQVDRHGVIYLDGGWQTLVEGLRARAIEAGVRIESSAKALRIEIEGGAARGVLLEGGRRLAAASIVIAASPRVVSSLLPDDAALAAYAARAEPIEASCFDVALSSLPRPRRRFLLGVGQPLYASVHSLAASLAPEGAALVHVARYLAPGEGAASEASLEHALETLQPGAGELKRFARYLPKMTVMHDLPRAAKGGLAARPDVLTASRTARGVAIAGDWVGAEGLLADASLASARAAAHALLDDSEKERVAA